MRFLHRDAVEADLPRIVEIYNFAVATRASSCDLEPTTVEKRYLSFIQHTPRHRPLWVALDADAVDFGVPISTVHNFTDVWVRREGRWQVAARDADLVRGQFTTFAFAGGAGLMALAWTLTAAARRWRRRRATMPSASGPGLGGAGPDVTPAPLAAD